jgi:hypothetical protein
MGMLPWSKRTSEDKKVASSSLVPIERKNEVAVRQSSNDIVIHNGPRTGGAIVQVRSKMMTVAGKKVNVDPYQLIRLIKRVTQNIGEYKQHEDVYGAVIIGALRKARGDLVNILEDEFHIHWQISPDTGESTFYM